MYRLNFFVASLLISAALSGCSLDNATTPSPVGSSPQAPPPLTSGTCDASRAEFTVGQKASDELLERGKTAAGASLARYLRPNQPITMEYAAGRLNLYLNANDMVEKVSCG